MALLADGQARWRGRHGQETPGDGGRYASGAWRHRRQTRLAAAASRSQIARVATAEEIDLAILRRMTPAQKLDVMQGLWRQAWALKVAGVRMQHPDWREDRVTAEVREIFRREPA